MLQLMMFVFLLCVPLGSVGHAAADEPSLAITQSGVTRRFTASELLARPDAAAITIDNDVAYRRSAEYRAVPLLDLLSNLPAEQQADTLESRAADGFVAQIPLSLARSAARGVPVPWIAIEPPGQPWADLPGKPTGPGPFYLVWQNADRSRVTSEQWPYQLASLTVVQSPAQRWPQLAVDSSLPPNAAARHGEMVFIGNCLPCHRLNGGGAGEMGPDLGKPMNSTTYLTEKGLRSLVRDSRAVRTWPLQQMPAFSSNDLPETDLDALIVYLEASSHHKHPAKSVR